MVLSRRVLHNALVRHVTQVDLLPGDSHGFTLQVRPAIPAGSATHNGPRYSF